MNIFCTWMVTNYWKKIPVVKVIKSINEVSTSSGMKQGSLPTIPTLQLPALLDSCTVQPDGTVFSPMTAQPGGRISHSCWLNYKLRWSTIRSHCLDPQSHNIICTTQPRKIFRDARKRVKSPLYYNVIRKHELYAFKPGGMDRLPLDSSTWMLDIQRPTVVCSTYLSNGSVCKEPKNLIPSLL